MKGTFAAFGILGALNEREHSGRGRRVEVSMLEAMSYFNLDDFTHYFSEGEIMGPYSRPRVSQSYVFECKDGKWIALHLSSPQKFWDGLATAIGRPNLFEDPRFADRVARICDLEKTVAVRADHGVSSRHDGSADRLPGKSVDHTPLAGPWEPAGGRQH